MYYNKSKEQGYKAHTRKKIFIMIKITVVAATATQYNVQAGDWSGDMRGLDVGALAETGATIETTLYRLLDSHFWGPHLGYIMDSLLSSLKENADGSNSVIRYVGDETGNYDDNGGYLIDLSLNVETIMPADIVELLTD